ncbi:MULTISPECIES: F0F1 ATP synthase subunit epsilon [Allobranchiibius]|uniref:ATP synthase epsilon chain n=1 Tax=Allobranchiibius huperziae TaxID=1874116 RepID=A0A853DK85_9MICO|nr:MULTISPECIES: F0F1 ATP synthase subunit epsilon [unclassified Allobranchiibius]MBO1755890.1 F0F1 ATP synthase subunit epsilon [Allobranchiibius sp. CTAmp26]MBO1767605.1 F0F1 ATP synthase subunit epsilon [Allobranchiibius sp. GilTou38]NYJ75394.1 F-type H+-transporting ATPase subunit epsilon [Allobranchiibius huperziae]UIJ36413.1 F0F1 ATP synthase subunit epsilon [Allobranchiibius sp. GilTou73]
MAPLDVQLVAADRLVWEGEANGVSARTTEGELGILPGHAPLLSVLVDGEVRIDPADGQRRVAKIDGGFVSVDNDKVTVVAETVDASDF